MALHLEPVASEALESEKALSVLLSIALLEAIAKKAEGAFERFLR